MGMFRKLPKQGLLFGMRGTLKKGVDSGSEAVCVRDDAVEPWRTIFRTWDGVTVSDDVADFEVMDTKELVG